MKKRILSAVLALCLTVTLLPVTVGAAEPMQGAWGTNLTWTYDAASQTLTVRGTGAMSNEESDRPAEFSAVSTEARSVVIERGVLSVGTAAFQGWPALEKVTLPAGLAAVGANAFQGCASLREAVLPDTVRYLGTHAFAESGLLAAKIPEGVLEIGSGAFFQCTALQSVKISGGPLAIGWSAFEGCASLASVDGLEHVDSIGKGAFLGCAALTSIRLGPGVRLGFIAFQDCTGLTELELPEDYIIEGVDIFKGCTGLTTVTIPESAVRDLFSGCTKVQTVHYGGSEYGGSAPFLNPENWGFSPNVTVNFAVDSGVYRNGDTAFCIWEYDKNANVLNLESARGTIERPSDGALPWDTYRNADPLITFQAESAARPAGLADGVFPPNTVVHAYDAYTLLKNNCFPSDLVVHPLAAAAAVKATCHSAGSTAGAYCTRGCAQAEAIAPRSVPQTAHRLEDLAEVPATCISTGSAYGKICGEHGWERVMLQPLELPLAGHAWSSTTSMRPDKPATCVQPGTMTRYASCTTVGCDAILELESNIPGQSPSVLHDWGKWSVTEEPTETDPGKQERRCTVCSVAVQTVTVGCRLPGAYVITYDTQGGSDDGFRTVTDANGVLRDPITPEREGYIRNTLGWYSAPSGGSPLSTPLTFDKDTTIYAQWEKRPYTIRFDTNGSTQAAPQAKKTASDGSVSDLPTLSPYQVDTDDAVVSYQFAGWFTKQTGGDAVSNGAVFTQDATLYAHWQPVVQYKIGLGTQGGELPDGQSGVLRTAADGSGRLDSLPTPTRAGYTFLGWFTEPAGGKEITLPHRFIGKANVWAHWERTSYTITFEPGGGSFQEERDQRMVTNENGMLDAMPVPVQSGYQFLGWYSEPGGNNEVSADRVFTENTTLYAHWMPDPLSSMCRITLSGSPGWFELEGSEKEILCAAGTQLRQLPTPVNPTFVFDGWYTKSLGGEAIKLPYLVEGDAVFYAHWKNPRWTVTLMTQGGMLPDGRNTLPVGESGMLTSLPSAERAGYTFQGWFTEASGGTHVTVDYRFSSDTTLYAQWLPGPYKVMFYPNGGLFSAEESGIRFTDAENGNRLKDLPEPSWPGYQFNGWFTARNGGDLVDETTEFTQDTRVYAQWRPEQPDPTIYSVTLELDGGELPPGQSATVMTDERGVLRQLPVPTRNCHSFQGWFTEASGGRQVHTPYVCRQDVTLYAKWYEAGHAWGEEQLEEEELPTCERDGHRVVSYTCALCGKVERREEVLPAAHTGVELLPGRPASCEDDGLTEGSRCNDCGEVLVAQTVLPALGHDWVKSESGSETVVQAPTCTEEGSKSIDGAECARCGAAADSTITVTLPANGHSWGEETEAVTKAPACTQNGVKTYTRRCTVEGCGGEETRTEDIPATGHLYGAWVMTKPPTAVQAGTRERVCAVCGNTETDSVPATGGSASTPGTSRTYTVTFDANGGAGGTTRTTGTDGRLSALPGAPTRTGYSFGGWFTAASGGEAVTTATVFSGDATVYAHWNRQSAPSAALYEIYTPDRVTGGSVAVSHSSASEGTDVTIRLGVQSGYELGRLSVVSLSTGQELRLTSGYSNEYRFAMPASAVVVNVTLNSWNGAAGGDVPVQPPVQDKPVKWYFQNGQIYHTANGPAAYGDVLTRDMLVCILYNLDPNSFGDPTVWADAHDIVPDIYDSWLWGGDKTVTREQTAAILFCYARHMGYNTSQRASLSGYADSGQIRAAAWTAMSWSRGAGIITGTSGTTLSPQAVVTCGQAGIILSRFLSNVAGIR